MPPPELAGDAPRLDVFKPVVVCFLATLRHDLDLARTHGLERRANYFLGIHKPLIRQHRLDHHFGAVAERLHDRLVLDIGHKAGLALALLVLELFAHQHGEAFGCDLLDHLFARFKTVKATQLFGHKVERVCLCNCQLFQSLRDFHRHWRSLVIGRAIGAHMALGVHQAVERNARPFGDFVVVEIMRAGDLYGTRAKIHVGVFICDDRDEAAVLFRPHGDFTELADDGRIARVIRVHGDRAIAQHRLGAGRRNSDIITLFFERHIAVFVFLDVGICRPVRERVFEVPHVACNFEVFDLKIGDRCFEMRIPVDQTLAAIDEPLLIHFNKNLDHSIVEIWRILVANTRVTLCTRHGKSVAIPIT